MKWQLVSDRVPQNLEEVFSILLENRGVTNHDEFFSPRRPLDLSLLELEVDADQVRTAISIIKQARDEKQKVVVFGDYDADGVCASTIMWQTLHRLGVAAMPFIPHREKHGYGVSMAAIDEITANNIPSVMITVDNGIVAHEPIQRLRDMGVQVIVTDHHQPEQQLPPAAAVVHTAKLCGSTVAWVFCRELIKELAPDELEWLNEQLDVAAIATVADQVPLLGANRSFAKHGMTQLRLTNRVGLKLLMKDAGVEQANLDTYHINFALAPRINAMGRLEHGLDALRLLCTADRRRAEELVKLLAGTNTRRQDMTMSMVDQAVTQVGAVVTDKIIIVASAEYHEGVIGLIAGRLMEKYARPALAIRLGENELLRVQLVPYLV
jgi:single-stranded-DNA-specific exonuclease